MSKGIHARIASRIGLALLLAAMCPGQDSSGKDGERKYGNRLKGAIELGLLQPADQAAAEGLHRRLSEVAARRQDWLPADQVRELDAFIEKIRPAFAGFEEELLEEFSRRCLNVEAQTKRVTFERFEDWAAANRPTWNRVELAPFCFMVQSGNDSMKIARAFRRQLEMVQNAILQEFGKELGLEPPEGPVPVLIFSDYRTYAKYVRANPEGNTAPLAHFEPDDTPTRATRLVVHLNCDATDVRHEATHQFFWEWRKSRPGATSASRSYWFDEGIAEWYSGVVRSPADGAGDPKYDPSLLLRDNLKTILGAPKDKLYDLTSLVSTPYRDKPAIENQGRTLLVYAQSWMLIYFLNHHGRAPDGSIRSDAPGMYQAKWRNYVKEELKGNTGCQVFMECLGLDDKGLQRLEKEYWEFVEFLRKK